MSFGLQHGHIGSKEIQLAIKELESNSWRDDKNIYIQKKGNNIVVGQWFNKVEELSEHGYMEWNLESHIADCIENDEDYDIDGDVTEYIDELKEGKTIYTVYDGNEIYYAETLGEAIYLSLGDGEISIFNYEEAIENLESSFVNETLVIWLLK